nr:ABC transporter permease [bacterium]
MKKHSTATKRPGLLPWKIEMEKRPAGSVGGVLWARLVAVAGLVIFLVLFLLVAGKGKSLGSILEALFIRPFFTLRGLNNTLLKVCPLLIASIGVSLAFRVKLWNIGGEGQIMMGAFGAAWMALLFPNLPAILLVPLMFIAAFIMGAIWAGIAGGLRAQWNVNETIITLMLNYIATEWVRALVYGPWRDPAAGGFPQPKPIPQDAWLKRLIPGVEINGVLILALILLAVYGIFIMRSRWGYKIRVIGDAPGAARYAGISVKKNILLAMLLSGGIVGLAGAGEVTATHMIQVNISGGFGFTAVLVAWLSNLNPLGILGMTVLLSGMQAGVMSAQIYGLPAALGQAIQGVLLFMVLALDYLTHYRFRIVRRAGKEG